MNDHLVDVLRRRPSLSVLQAPEGSLPEPAVRHHHARPPVGRANEVGRSRLREDVALLPQLDGRHRTTGRALSHTSRMLTVVSRCCPSTTSSSLRSATYAPARQTMLASRWVSLDNERDVVDQLANLPFEPGVPALIRRHDVALIRLPQQLADLCTLWLGDALFTSPSRR